MAPSENKGNRMVEVELGALRSSCGGLSHIWDRYCEAGEDVPEDPRVLLGRAKHSGAQSKEQNYVLSVSQRASLPAQRTDGHPSIMPGPSSGIQVLPSTRLHPGFVL